MDPMYLEFAKITDMAQNSDELFKTLYDNFCQMVHKMAKKEYHAKILKYVKPEFDKLSSVYRNIDIDSARIVSIWFLKSITADLAQIDLKEKK